MFDRIVSIGLFIFGCIGFYMALQLPKSVFAGQLGAGVFPMFVCVLIAVTSIFLFLESKPKKEQERKIEETEPEEKKWDKDLTYVLIALVLYVFCFERIGFILSSMLLVFGVGFLLKAKNKLTLAVFSVLFPLSFYMLFNMLGIHLPNGILPF